MTPEEVRHAENLFKHGSCLTVFALLYMDGTQQQEVLQITQRHYRNVNTAENWYRTKQRDITLAEQYLTTSMSNQARNILGQLRINMLKHGR